MYAVREDDILYGDAFQTVTCTNNETAIVFSCEYSNTRSTHGKKAAFTCTTASTQKLRIQHLHLLAFTVDLE